MTRYKRTAGILAVLLLFAVLFAILFVVLEAGHECCGDGCEVCARIQICLDLLRKLVPYILPGALTAAFCTAAGALPDPVSLFFSKTSPVSLKVKLSN